jgi:hypothetical protein
MNKVCSICEILKDISDFPKNKNVKSGYDARCKDCRNIYLKKYREKEECKKIAKLYNKEYRKENKDVLYKKQRDYLKTDKGKEVRKKAVSKYNTSAKRKNGSLKKYNNSNKRRVYANNWYKNKYNTEVDFKLKCCVSSQVRHYFKKNGNKTIDILGYEIGVLKEHLENQFSKEMTWENYGTYWNIDHIIPQSLYDFTKDEEIKKCWSLKNLRPLKITENCSKQGCLDGKLIEEYSLCELLPKGIEYGNERKYIKKCFLSN